MGGYFRHRVYMTPISNLESKTYGDEIDVSDRIEIGGIGNIKKSLDAMDYQTGVFYYSDITLSGLNFNGYFNESSDSRSIFPVTRDLCKVRVVFEEIEVERDSNNRVTDETTVSEITFMGLINEEGTRHDVDTDKITFKVLSRDSVLRTTKVSGGVITNGMSFSAAIYAALNTTRITSVMTLDLANINPAENLTVDDATFFEDITVKEALDALLVVSNSVSIIDDTGAIIVKDRQELDERPILNLYGPHAIGGRENIIKVSSFNSGYHRAFTSVKVNDTVSTNDNLSATFGFRQKEVDLGFITDGVKEQQIADAILEEFQNPKIEMVVQVPKRIARELQLLDRVSINHPLRTKPPSGTFLPVVGATKIGDASMPLPETHGSFNLLPRFAFKVIEIVESTKDFTATLKLRQTNDFVFDTPNNCIVGFAIVGEAEICAGADECLTWNPSVIGAARVGCTEIA